MRKRSSGLRLGGAAEPAAWHRKESAPISLAAATKRTLQLSGVTRSGVAADDRAPLARSCAQTNTRPADAGRLQTGTVDQAMDVIPFDDISGLGIQP